VIAPRPLLAVLLVVLAAGCAIQGASTGAARRAATASQLTMPSSVAPDPAKGPSPAPPSPLDLYKQSAAKRIVERNKPRVFEGVPEHFLRSIVVLRLAVDVKGTVRSANLYRGNGYTELEAAARTAALAASPLPPPPTELLRGGVLEFNETWLFRKDGKFQVRSIALPQSSTPENASLAAGKR